MNQLKHLTNITDPPEVVRMCLNCRRAECPGKCDAVIEARRMRSSNRTGKAPARYTVNGQTHTAAEWAEIIGVSEYALRLRMKKGMSMAEAIAHKPTKISTGEKLYTAHGRAQTMRQWAAESGIPAGTLRCRMYRDGMSFEQALDRGQKPRRR